MGRGSARITGVLLITALAGLGASGWLAGKTVGTGGPGAQVPEGTPSGVRFVVVALGGFRGLLADALWVRASNLQDEGSFFEVAQLTEWITYLEPRSPEIWSYHAWNLAYNIGAMFPDPADRWRWVQNGLHLLRDKGIPANPDDPRLYWELGWLYADKVSGRWEPNPLYYRVQFAHQIAAGMHDGVFRPEPVPLSPSQSAWLRAVGLNADVMTAADERYGPLDWRLPEAHSLYWGLKGRPYQNADAPWCDRLIWVAMTEMVHGGTLAFDAAQRVYLRGPRLDVAMKGVRRYEADNVFASPLTAAAGENFLREAILFLYAFDHAEAAAEALAVLGRHGQSAQAGVSLAEFVRQEVSARMKGLGRATAEDLVRGMLTSGVQWNRLGHPEFSAGYVQLARWHWDAWVAVAGTAAPSDPDAQWSRITDEARGVDGRP